MFEARHLYQGMAHIDFWGLGSVLVTDLIDERIVHYGALGLYSIVMGDQGLPHLPVISCGLSSYGRSNHSNSLSCFHESAIWF